MNSDPPPLELNPRDWPTERRRVPSLFAQFDDFLIKNKIEISPMAQMTILRFFVERGARDPGLSAGWGKKR